MANMDDWGGVAVDSQQKADDWGGIPVTQPIAPKAPDMSGVQKMAQDNLAANDNKKPAEDGQPKQAPTPEQQLDTAAGMPVKSLMDGSANPPAAVRGQYVKALQNGSASDGPDFLQTLIRGVAPVAYNLYSEYDNITGGGASSGAHGVIGSIVPSAVSLRAAIPAAEAAALAASPLDPVTFGGASVVAGLAAGAAAGFAANYATSGVQDAALRGAPETAEALGQSPAQRQKDEAEHPNSYFAGSLLPNLAFIGPGGVTRKSAALFGTIGAGQEAAREKIEGEPLSGTKIALSALAMGGANKNTPLGEWFIPELKNMAGKHLNKSPDAVTPQDFDQIIAQNNKSTLPAGRDFKTVAKVFEDSTPASPWEKVSEQSHEQTLHVIYQETGIKPDQVFADAQHNPEIAADVVAGKVPEAYGHLVEPKILTEEREQGLKVERDEAGRGFRVVDSEGDHVQSGFDSAEEARQHIEDRQFEAEERAAIEGEGKEEPTKNIAKNKLVDKNGAPLIMYRGAFGDESFAHNSKAGSATDAGNLGSGLYGSPSKNVSRSYGKDVREIKMELHNPVEIVRDGNYVKNIENAADVLGVKSKSEWSGSKQISKEFADEFSDKAVAAGHDGAVSRMPNGDIVEAVSYNSKEHSAESVSSIPETEKTAQDKQGVISGEEKISDESLSDHLMDKAERSEKKPIEIFEPKLPRELAGAKPRYGYGKKQFMLKFDSDIDRAAYIAAQDVKKSKADSKYVDFLKNNGMSDAEISTHGAKVKEAIKTMAKDAKAGELIVPSLRKSTIEPIAEKSQKPLTNKAIPPSEMGKPTSLYSFIRNNGKIKPDIYDSGDLKSQQHTDLLSSNGKTSDTMRELAEQHGYVKEGMSVPEFHDLINDTNGGREHFRPTDADRILKSIEAERVRANADPMMIDMEAQKIGLDTDPYQGENEKQRLTRLINQLSDFYRNTEGAARIRSEAGEWLLTKPIQAVEKFTGKLTGGFFQKLGEGYIKTFQPELMGDKALRTDSYLAKYKTAKQEAENSFYRSSEKLKAAWDKMPTNERMQWLYDHETGRWNEKDDLDHARYQALLDATFKAEKEAIGADADKGYKENYLPHSWENPEAVKAFFNSPGMIKKYGKDGFTKASTFQLIQDGIRAGFKLKTDNPESMLLARLLAGHDMIATMDLLKDMEGSGLAKKATAFGIDKKIGKTEKAIAEIQTKYAKELGEIEKQKSLVDENGKSIGEPVSKKISLVHKRLDNLNNRLEDFRVEKNSNKLSPAQMAELKNGFRVIGPDSKVWNIHPQGAPIWRNAMEMKGLYENQGAIGDAYRAYNASKSAWVAAKLGLSLFHPVHVAMINLASGISGAAEHLIQGGKFSDLALKDTGITLGLTKETFKGEDHPAVKAWNTAPDVRTPDQQKIVQTMIEGGFKPTMSARDTIHFRENFDKAINGIGLNNLRLLGTAIQLPGKLMAPFFEHWIPGMKSEIYLRRAEEAVQRDPSLANDSGRRGEIFRQIAKDADRTYGEMNQDVQFWNPIVRDSFNAAFISGGWKLAQIYNARGLLQPLKIAGKFAKTGEFSKADITYNMLHAYTYTGLTLALGGAMNAMLGNPIGEAKDGIWDMVKNLVAPKTGELNPDGTPIRLNQPAFAKEAYNLAHEINTKGLIGGAGSFLYHQTLIPSIMDVLNNQDFTGRKIISDPTDLHQWMNAGWDSINPISLQGYERAEAKGSEVAKAAGVLGFPMAGAYINQTPFEQKVIATYDEQNPPKGDVYQVKLKADLKAAVAKGNSAEQDKIEARMKEEGMTDKQIENARKPFTKNFSEIAWGKLSTQDQKRLIESASDEEKSKYKIKGE